MLCSIKTKNSKIFNSLQCIKHSIFYFSSSVSQKQIMSKIKDTETHLCAVFPIGWCHWTMLRVPEWFFQQWWWICTDPFTHSHPGPFDQSLWICKDNHSRLRVDFAGMYKDMLLLRQQFIPMLLVSWLWHILILYTHKHLLSSSPHK